MASTATNRLATIAAVLVAIGWPAMVFSDQEPHTVRAQRDGPAAVSPQIPERAEWEITFAQVEAAAGWPDLRGAAPNTFEARVMDRAGQAVAPVTFLRMVRTGRALRAELFVFWGRNISPAHEPQGDDVRCRDGVCVKPINLAEQRDWEKVVSSLARQSACPRKNPPETVLTADGGLTSSVTVCPHCPMIYIKSVVEGTYREQVCDDPPPESEAGRLRALMRGSADAIRR